MGSLQSNISIFVYVGNMQKNTGTYLTGYTQKKKMVVLSTQPCSFRASLEWCVQLTIHM